MGPKTLKLRTRSMLGIGKMSELVGGMSVRAGSWMWSWGYVGFEKFEAAGFFMREREGLVKGIVDKAKAVCS